MPLEITVNGVRTKYQSRQLAMKLLVKQALEKQRTKDLAALVAMAVQHFPELKVADREDPVSGSHNDRDLLAQLFAGLALGEAVSESASPLSDAMVPSVSEERSEETWDDEDWDRPGASGEEGGLDD